MRNTIWRAVAVVAVVCAAVVGGSGVAGAEADSPTPCERGEFCLWTADEYTGAIHRVALDTANAGECVPLPADFTGRSFANRGSRLVTVYQGPNCETESDFATYPGGGTFVPAAPFAVRGVQIWEH